MKSLSQKFVLISLLLQLCLAVPERVNVEEVKVIHILQLHSLFLYTVIHLTSSEVLIRADYLLLLLFYPHSFNLGTCLHFLNVTVSMITMLYMLIMHKYVEEMMGKTFLR